MDLTAVFDPHPLPGTYRAGPLELTGVPLPHFVPNAGIRVRAGEVAFAYSGDTGPDPMLAELGRNADLFIIEATDRDGETQRPARNLMTSAEAGRWGRPAGRRPQAHAYPLLARQRSRGRDSRRLRRVRRRRTGSHRGPHHQPRPLVYPAVKEAKTMIVGHLRRI